MAGIEWRAANAEAFLDEIPSAYEDIDQVMDDAKTWWRWTTRCARS